MNRLGNLGVVILVHLTSSRNPPHGAAFLDVGLLCTFCEPLYCILAFYLLHALPCRDAMRGRNGRVGGEGEGATRRGLFKETLDLCA